MNTVKNEKIKESLKHAVAEFLGRESNRLSLITVTDARLNRKCTEATILITVLPEEMENAALKFADRNRTELASFLKKRVNMQYLPHFTFAIDLGEKNRQRIEALSQNS